MQRGDDEVESLEDAFVVIHPPILEDVGLDAFQHPEVVEPAVHLIDLLGLPSEVLRPQSAGIGGRLAVVGDSEVLVAGILASDSQLLDGVRAVRVARVAVEKAFEILLTHQRGYGAVFRGLHFPGAFPKLGRYEIQTERPIEGLLVRCSHKLTSPPQGRAGQGVTLLAGAGAELSQVSVAAGRLNQHGSGVYWSGRHDLRAGTAGKPEGQPPLILSRKLMDPGQLT